MGDKPIYDTVEGIRIFMASLEGFHALIAARHAAGYERREDLTEFYVMGRWGFDRAGNIGMVMMRGEHTEQPLKELFPEIPDISTFTEFRQMLVDVGRGDDSVAINFSDQTWPPPAGMACTVCGKTWAIDNAHDAHTKYSSQVDSLELFVGRLLSDFTDSLKERSDSTCSMNSDKPVRNDRYVDLSPHPRLRGAHVVNDLGWVGASAGIGPDYVIRDGDEGFVHVRTYQHSACHAATLAARMEAMFDSAFQMAGYQASQLIAIPNQYGSGDYLGPWFEVRTELGVITIGWRRRVIQIDWSQTGRDLEHLFEEAGTKAAQYVHAYGYREASEYLGRIRVALTSRELVEQ